MNMLSLKVLEWLVILVGLVINGCDPMAYNWSMKSLVAACLSCVVNPH